MEEKDVQHILIEILCASVNEAENNESLKEKVTPDMLLSVYRLAKKHDLAHVVSQFVYRNRIPIEQELQNKLQHAEIVSVYRHEQMKSTYEEISGVLEGEGIAYIPLKGSVLRPYYPYESMRTSCDIDILIRETDMDSAVSALAAKGYTVGERNYHDVSLYSPCKIHLELHFSITENKENIDAVLKDAWDHVVPKSGCQYAFKDDFFAFHIFSHMMYHFVSGGCGIRSLLDIWVMEHKMGITHECAAELLEKAGIYKFAQEMSRLADRCFTHGDKDAFMDPVLGYIFKGGVYGTAENRIAVDKSKTGNLAAYVLKRLFLPYRSMVIVYPILKRAPYLLPIYWGVRWWQAIFGNRAKRAAFEMAHANQMSDQTVREVTEIRSLLGL